MTAKPRLCNTCYKRTVSHGDGSIYKEQQTWPESLWAICATCSSISQPADVLSVEDAARECGSIESPRPDDAPLTKAEIYSTMAEVESRLNAVKQCVREAFGEIYSRLEK